MVKIHRVLGSGIVLSLVFSSMTAFVWAGEVKKREENQQNRVAQGVKSGELTAGETARIEKGEQKIEADRKAALADGKMTRKEKKKLNREENKESKKIHHLKHNEKKA